MTDLRPSDEDPHGSGAHHAPQVAVSGFSSFPAGQLAEARQKQSEALQERSQHELLQAAARYLDSSASEGEEGEGRANRGACSSSSSSDSGYESKHSRHGRKRGREGRSKESKKEKKHKNKKQKHGKKERGKEKIGEHEKILRLERQAAAAGIRVRQGGGSAFTLPVSRDMFYFDTRGDIENLVYEELYAGNKAIFKRRDPLNLAKDVYERQALWAARNPVDSIVQGPPTARYFSPRQHILERSRKLKRVRMREAGPRHLAHLAGGKQPHNHHAPAPPPFISLASSSNGADWAQAMASTSASSFLQGGAKDKGAEEQLGLTLDEYVLSRTREFSIATRETPEDLDLWLEYADFQQEASRLLNKRAGDGAAEKRVAILEKALQWHPNQERLLLALLEASASLLSNEALDSRWRNQVLKQHRGSVMLWSEYIRLRRSQFSSFTTTRIEDIYSNALHGISLHKMKCQREGESPLELEKMEMGLVRLALDLIQFEMQSGHSEIAVARIQATLEFQCFNPSAPLRSLEPKQTTGQLQPVSQFGNQLRMFESFWDGGERRVGEEGGLAWSNWFRSVNRDSLVGFHADDAAAPEEANQDAGPSWSGWVELAKPEVPESTGGQEGGLLTIPPMKGAVSISAAEAAEKLPGGEAEGVAAAWKVASAGLDDERPEEGRDSAVEGAGRGGEKTGVDGRDSSSDDEDEGVDEGEGEGGRPLKGATGEDEADGEEGSEDVEVEGALAAPLSEEVLLAELGLKLEADLEAMQKKGMEPHILERWLKEEAQRGASQWLPARSKPTGGSYEDADDDDVDINNVVYSDDITESIFPLAFARPRQQLVLGCLTLLGAPLQGLPHSLGDVGASCQGFGGSDAYGMWSCSNVPLLLDPQDPLVSAPMPGDSLTPLDARDKIAVPSFLLPATQTLPWYAAHDSRRQLLSSLLGVLIGVQGQSPPGPLSNLPNVCLAFLLLQAMQVSEPDSNTGDSGGPDSRLSSSGAMLSHGPRLTLGQAARARDAAKGVLSKQRNNLAMWGALAQLEALLGQHKTARRILDTALSSAPSVPEVDRKQVLPLLVVQYADLELSLADTGRNSDGSTKPVAGTFQARAHHVLQWYLSSANGQAGSSGLTPYQPFVPKQATSTTAEAITAARMGFGQMVPHLSTLCLSGELDSAGAAAILAGSMFEILTGHLGPASAQGGLRGALGALKNTAGMTEARVRSQSAAHEWLLVRCCHQMVDETTGAVSRVSSGDVPPARVREELLQALSLFPRNSHLLSLLAVVEQRAHALIRLRQFLHTAAEEKPTPLLFAAALRFEASRPGGMLRLQAMFERAATSRQLVSSSLVWRMYLRYEVAQGRIDAARRVFLRAIRECPSCKELWMEGLAALGTPLITGGANHMTGDPRVDEEGGPRGGLPPREVSELVEVAQAKGLKLRTDVMEVMLQVLQD